VLIATVAVFGDGHPPHRSSHQHVRRHAGFSLLCGYAVAALIAGGVVLVRRDA
jgi:hypothetical protein